MRTSIDGTPRAVRRAALSAAALFLGAALGFVAYSLLVGLGVIDAILTTSPGECRPAIAAGEPARPSQVYNELHGVDVLSPTLAWAVGTHGEEDLALPLIERWDGTTWQQADVPSVPDFSNHLYAVAASSPNDAWAVGASHRGTGVWRTMAMHWDGTKWAIIPTPTVGTVSSLNSVAGSAANDVWAVGETSTGQKGLGSSVLTMRWDGIEWRIEDTGIRLSNAILSDVTAIAPDDLWAVGSYSDASGTVLLPLAIHWDGTKWSQATLPGQGELWSVSAASRSEGWAVGNFGPQSLALKWDGENWSRVPSPNPGKSNVLYSVAAAQGEAWAAGSYNENGRDVPFVAWLTDGTWRPMPAPVVGRISDTLWGIDVVGQEGWVVGSSIQDGQGNNAPVALEITNRCSE